MRRKPGELLPLEVNILAAAMALSARGIDQFHGFKLAREMQELDNSRSILSTGALYKALSRLENEGLLSSSWEAPVVAEAEGRPRRRYYVLTCKAIAVLRDSSGHVLTLRDSILRTRPVAE